MASAEAHMLAEAIKGKSDAEIGEFVEAMGLEGLLDQTFEGMKSALNPDKARDSVIGYELSHSGAVYPYVIVIRDRAATIEKRPPTDARVTLKLSVPDYLRLITGQLPVFRSVLTRRLRMVGDRKFARQMQEMFRSSSSAAG